MSTTVTMEESVVTPPQASVELRTRGLEDSAVEMEVSVVEHCEGKGKEESPDDSSLLSPYERGFEALLNHFGFTREELLVHLAHAQSEGFIQEDEKLDKMASEEWYRARLIDLETLFGKLLLIEPEERGRVAFYDRKLFNHVGLFVPGTNLYTDFNTVETSDTRIDLLIAQKSGANVQVKFAEEAEKPSYTRGLAQTDEEKRQAVGRALTMIVSQPLAGRYHFLLKNCECLVTWICTGKSGSKQVESGAVAVGLGLATVAVGVSMLFAFTKDVTSEEEEEDDDEDEVKEQEQKSGWSVWHIMAGAVGIASAYYLGSRIAHKSKSDREESS